MTWWDGARQELLDRAFTASLWDTLAVRRDAAGDVSAAVDARRSAALNRMSLLHLAQQLGADYLCQVGRQLALVDVDDRTRGRVPRDRA